RLPPKRRARAGPSSSKFLLRRWLQTRRLLAARRIDAAQFAAVLARIQHHLPVALAQLAMLRALLPRLHRQILRGGVVALLQRALRVLLQLLRPVRRARG